MPLLVSMYLAWIKPYSISAACSIRSDWFGLSSSSSSETFEKHRLKRPTEQHDGEWSFVTLKDGYTVPIRNHLYLTFQLGSTITTVTLEHVITHPNQTIISCTRMSCFSRVVILYISTGYATSPNESDSAGQSCLLIIITNTNLEGHDPQQTTSRMDRMHLQDYPNQ